MAAGVIASVEPAGDLRAVGARWQALEAQCEAGFFLSWTFIGCMAETRFAGAWLLSVTQDGQDVALAMLGRRGRSAFLNETGVPAADAVFIEHNGLLVRPGADSVLVPAFRAVLRQFRALTLSGVGEPVLAAAEAAGAVRRRIRRFAPAVDLTALDRPFLDTLSANARAQIRRAMRCYAELPQLARAESVSQALDWFADLVALHQATWISRGRPGAFADTAIKGFHQALIERGFAQGAVDLLRVSAGPQTVGVLYCFIGNGRVLSYQSGFAYVEDTHAKPGLVCHALAIEYFTSRGLALYDLLGGADRYKLTLARAGETLHWATLHRRWSLRGLASRLLNVTNTTCEACGERIHPGK